MFVYMVVELSFILCFIFGNIDWGIFWSAFSAIGTVSAVAVAYWQIKKQTDERNSDLEKEQASKISAWFIEGTAKDKNGSPLTDINGVASRVIFNNKSELPIYEAFVLSSHIRANNIPLEESITHYVYFDVIPPGEKEVGYTQEDLEQAIDQLSPFFLEMLWVICGIELREGY
ncbi:hypothetical protein [Lactococcus protaetiae]|uniref:Uncharacterized protein n=1 Tax=Lactococcus protaetiae TaxID=2592653 RepID=A0A514ZA39_9LACT|nr:hypothetical protein [Lactococcus protaetiae]QDK71448.1 hypothetical protein FLP15_10110 [Lactococcus protaetiae]